MRARHNRRSRSATRVGRRPGVRIEALESRALLSGLVEVDVRGGHLFVTGDETDNSVAITVGSIPGEISVAGLEGTTIVYKSALSEITGDVHIRMMGGDDIVLVSGSEEHDHETTTAEEEHEDPEPASLPSDLDIDMGEGDDGVRIQSVKVGRDLTIDTARGHDTVDIGRGPTFGEYEEHDHDDGGHEAGTITTAAESDDHDGGHDGGDGGPRPDVIVEGGVQIRTGGGDDAVKFAFARVAGNLAIETGTGDDTVVTGRGPIRGQHGEGEGEDGGEGGHGSGQRPPDLRVGGDVQVLTGTDDDFALLRNTRVGGYLTYHAGPGDDAIGGQNLRVVGPAIVATTEGDDRVALYDSVFDDALDLDTGPGNDHVGLVGTTFGGPATLWTGPGEDAVLFSGCTAKDVVRVETGPGDDVVALVDSNTFLAELLLDGGPGSDHLIDDRTNTAPSTSARRFLDEPSVFDVDAALESLEDRFQLYLQGR